MPGPIRLGHPHRTVARGKALLLRRTHRHASWRQSDSDRNRWNRFNWNHCMQRPAMIFDLIAARLALFGAAPRQGARMLSPCIESPQPQPLSQRPHAIGANSGQPEPPAGELRPQHRFRRALSLPAPEAPGRRRRARGTPALEPAGRAGWLVQCPGSVHGLEKHGAKFLTEASIWP